MRPPLPYRHGNALGACTRFKRGDGAQRSSSVIILSRVSERTRASARCRTPAWSGNRRRRLRGPARDRPGCPRVTIPTGMKCVAGLDFSRRHHLETSISGIITSSRMMSHSARAQISSASARSTPVRNENTRADSRASKSLTLGGRRRRPECARTKKVLPYPINRRTFQ